MSITTVSIGESTKASWANSVKADHETLSATVSLKTGSILSATVSSTVAANDGVGTVLLSPATASVSVTLHDASAEAGRELFIMKKGTGIGKVILNKTVRIAGVDYTTLELLQQNDFIKIKSDGTQWLKINPPYWHLADPTTGWHTSKTSGWTADSFSGGLEVDFSGQVPAGTKAVRCVIQAWVGDGGIWYRPSGDTNISNTPVADSENANYIGYVENDGFVFFIKQVVMWLSADYKIQIAVAVTDQDVRVSNPLEYMI